MSFLPQWTESSETVIKVVLFFQVCLCQMFVTMTESVTNTAYLILIPGWKGRRLYTEKVETYFLEYKTDSNYISIRRTVTVI